MSAYMSYALSGCCTFFYLDNWKQMVFRFLITAKPVFVQGVITGFHTFAFFSVLSLSVVFFTPVFAFLLLSCISSFSIQQPSIVILRPTYQLSVPWTV